MVAFVEEQFPHVVSVGSVGGPEFRTTIEEVVSGFEFRNSEWSQPRHRYDVATGITNLEELMMVKGWHLAMRGRAIGFRFQDMMDHSSAPDGGKPSATDCLLERVPGETTFLLNKDYGTFTREITKPVPGSLRVAIDGNEIFNFTADYTKGIVNIPTYTEGEVTAGFYFDVPVRFESDLFQARWDDVNLVSGSISLVELRIMR